MIVHQSFFCIQLSIQSLIINQLTMLQKKCFISLFLLFLLIQPTIQCINSDCASCNTFVYNNKLIQKCYICIFGKTLDQNSKCITNINLAIGIGVGGFAFLAVQIIIYILCKRYFKNLSKKAAQIPWQNIRQQQIQKQNDDDSSKKRYHIYETCFCQKCLLEKPNSQTNCEHFFHIQCLKQELNNKINSCPKCQKDKVSPISLVCELCFENDRKKTVQNKKDLNHLKKYTCGRCNLKYKKKVKTTFDTDIQ